MSGYVPDRDGDLKDFATNMNTLINADPASFSLTIAQAAAFTVLSDNYSAAYVLAVASSTRTAGTIAAKDTAREALVSGPGGIRELVAIIQSSPTTTNQQRADLQITVPDTDPTPAPIPDKAPTFEIVSQAGRAFQIRLRDADNPTSRAKPAGVKGALVYSFVGDEPPAAVSEWTMSKNTTRTLFEYAFPATVPDGSKVWITAFWYNTRGQSGPASEPQSTYIFGIAQAA